MSKTAITQDFFEAKDTIHIVPDIDEDNLSKTIVDLSLDQETRLNALNTHFDREGRDGTIDIINKLSMMYQLSGTKILLKFLYAICEHSKLDGFLKSIAAKGIWIFNEKDTKGYKAINMVIPQMGQDVGTPYRIEFIRILMDNEKYKKQCRDYFCTICNDQSINCDYRYKSILSLENNENGSLDYFIKEACTEFIQAKENDTRYRVLAGQYLLQKAEVFELSDEHTFDIEKTLLGFAQDEKEEYNCRADSADVLLQLGSDDNKNKARDIITSLSHVDRPVRTIFDNAQNIHTKEVEDSIKEGLEFLHSFDIMKIKKRIITFDYVEKKIKNILKKEKGEKKIGKNQEYPREENIKVSLNRIFMDRALYGRFRSNLSNILLRVWTYSEGHDRGDEIRERLLEELEDMSGTCSSGYIGRLVNTMSGFGDFSLRISWKEQIIANFSGRLTAKIREINDENFKNKVMDEMTLDTSDYESRMNFSRFLRNNMLKIREEMWNEFEQYVDDTDFDLYFRFAVSKYQTGSFV